MDISNLEKLEKYVNSLLEKHANTEREKAELVTKTEFLASQVEELQKSNANLQAELSEARMNLRNPEEEERIKAKVDDILAKFGTM